jgi:hypothetical protein
VKTSTDEFFLNEMGNLPAGEAPKTTNANIEVSPGLITDGISGIGFKTSAGAEFKQEKPENQTKLKRTRYVKASVRHEVTRRNEASCSYVDAKTGRMCGSTRYLELDHIEPFARGGPSTAENLRPMCGAHNRYRWAR